MTAGRIGSVQKRNEGLLEALANVYKCLQNWQARLVGGHDFERRLNDFCLYYLRISRKIVLAGSILKNELLSEYKRTKIFALTSVLECGPPNVVAEALFNGCYLITSEIDAADDVIDEERLLQGGSSAIAYH